MLATEGYFNPSVSSERFARPHASSTACMLLTGYPLYLACDENKTDSNGYFPLQDVARWIVLMAGGRSAYEGGE